jgi:transposase, IS30 family
MKQRPRIYYSASQRTIIWDRWRQGDTIHQIAGLFDRFHPSIQRILAETGGIRPVTRQRSKSALTLAEREEISRAVVTGSSIRSIAVSLGGAPSTSVVQRLFALDAASLIFRRPNSGEH